ncbi:hypothetical protein MFFC18_48200 [Mariniblastus fucicola]|uniref:Uncharacterized protein n=1 Tax=Mariniblastus fucicola TaxID=980251 RepID=A0A5B9PDW9_9BACT|nr:hypothetical protein MFFC18_48200 [Mariniblastus fucicola]
MNQNVLSPLFALLLFVAHLNCVLEHQLVSTSADGIVDSTLATSESHTPSPGESNSCEHGGCICEGATLAVEFEFTSFEEVTFGFDFLSVYLLVSRTKQTGNAAHHFSKKPACRLPLRASDRCAALQTFLI